jgi:hypothetical protein
VVRVDCREDLEMIGRSVQDVYLFMVITEAIISGTAIGLIWWLT